MHIVAPKRKDLAISPLLRIPPSVMIGLLAALAHQRKAANCQPPVPKPVLSLVMQTFPGPMPTLVASAPAFSSSRTPSGVPTLPAMTNVSGRYFLMCWIMSMTICEWPCAISMVMYSGFSLWPASSLTKANSSGFTPTEIEANKPLLCISATKSARRSGLKRCIT